jgi:hypothetical protein
MSRIDSKEVYKLLPDDILEINTKNCKQYIENIKNPNPAVIAIIIFGSMIVLYIFHLLVIKHNLTGSWKSDDNHVSIKHNIITDEISLKGYTGMVYHKMIIIYDANKYKMGLITDDGKTILWADNSQWFKR